MTDKIGWLEYNGIHMGTLAQFTIFQPGPGYGASFVIDLRTETITEELVRERMGKKILEFCIL